MPRVSKINNLKILKKKPRVSKINSKIFKKKIK